MLKPGCDSRRVFSVGDSLTVGVLEFGGYHSKLIAAGFQPTSVAQVGRFASWGVSQFRTAVAAGSVGGLVVAGFGTNDAYKTPPSYVGAFRQRVDEFMQIAGPDRTVVWVNLQFGKPGAATYADMVAMAEPFNQVLRDKALEWPNLVVLDWNSTPNRTNLGGDQMHYNTTGYRNRAAFIVEGLVAISCRPA
jgi:lysophospholipase L1-like esterase